MNKYRNYREDRAADQWLKSHGISKDFANIETLLLMAQVKAHYLISRHKHLLTQEQLKQVREYLQQMRSPKYRASISTKQCYRVLNLGKKIDRQVFRVTKTQANKTSLS